VIVEGDTLLAADLRSAPEAHAAAALPAAVPADTPSTATAGQSSPVVSDISAHRRAFEDFVDAIRSDREPACSGAEGRRSVAVVEAIYESARTGRSIPVR
jgi:predicted dehydrogenase